MKQLRGLGAVQEALDALKGQLWAISIDSPQTMREERAASHDFGGRYVHASTASLDSIGLLHQGRTKQLAAPASILLSPERTVAWTYYSAKVGERADPAAILDALQPWIDAAGQSRPTPESRAPSAPLSEDERTEHRATKRRLQEVLDALMDANEQISQLNQGLEALVERRTTALNSSLAQTKAVLQSMADGLISVDRSGTIRAVNPAFSNMLCIPPIPIGHSASGLLPGALLQLIDRAIQTCAVTTADFELLGGGMGAAKASPITEDAGGCVGAVLVLRDVTLEKRVDQMKTNFITTVSHELRTPLTSVLGFASLTARKLESHIFPYLPTGDDKRDRAVGQVRNNLRIITSEGTRLTALINDVLDISKMESGHVEWKRESLDPSALVEQALAATATLFGDNLEARTRIAPHLPPLIGDSDRLMQVLVNLISNAAKFTSEGWVEVRAISAEQGVEFTVSDTGIGIAPADQQTIFERFQQVGDPLTNKPGGTGLGLAICAQIVAAHHGTLRVHSEEGKGSQFVFWLPSTEEAVTVPAKPRSEPIPVIEPSAGQEILIVDDDPSLRALLRQQLSEHGYRVQEAANGLEGVQQVREHAPDLIVLDVKMPGISGFDVAAILKADPATRLIPLVILSATDDEQQGHALGVDDYFTKPTDADVLLAAIQRLLKRVASPDKLMVVEGRSDG